MIFKRQLIILAKQLMKKNFSWGGTFYNIIGYKYIGYHYGTRETENTRLSEILSRYGREYIKDNPLEIEKTKPEWEKYDDSFALYIGCLYNLDTGEEEITGAYWDYEM